MKRSCWQAVASSALALLSGCTIVSSRDNAAQAVQVAGRQQAPAAAWRRSLEDDAAAATRIDELLRDGLSIEDGIAVAFLANPDVQLAFEQLEISRTELVAASTAPNPIAIVGSRAPGGNLSAFYPDRTWSFGVLQNVLGLINLPARRKVAGIELERARLDAADRLVSLASDVNEAWLQYASALHVEELRQQAALDVRAMLELVRPELERLPDGAARLDSERVSLLGVEASALRAGLDAAVARARLTRLLGLAGRRDDWQVTDRVPPPPASEPDPVRLEQDALTARLDLQASRRALDARLEAAAVQKRWRWLGAAEAGAFREGSSGGPHFTGPNVLLELPLFDQRQAQILRTDAEARTALRRLELQLQTARGEIRTRAAELAVARQLLARYDLELLPALRRVQEAQGRGTLNGRRAGLTLLSAEEERTGLLRDYWRARGALARAAGAWEAMPDWPTATSHGAATP